MSSPTITAYVNLEKNSFAEFNEFHAIRIEDAAFRGLAEKMKTDLKTKGSSRVVLPWGTYTAKALAVGESGNITPVFEPSKNFITLLNDDAETYSDRDIRQEQFDPDYLKLFRDYVAYGYFYPEDTKDAPDDAVRGMWLSEEDMDWLLNEWMYMLAGLARDKQRVGKIYNVEVDEGFPHGRFDFKYGEEKIDVTFTPSKTFKQYLKDDDTAARAQVADFTEVSAAMIMANARKLERKPTEMRHEIYEGKKNKKKNR